jgi:hypothetical protein
MGAKGRQETVAHQEKRATAEPATALAQLPAQTQLVHQSNILACRIQMDFRENGIFFQ